MNFKQLTHNTNKLLFLLFIFIFYSTAFAPAEEQFFYKWKDEKGVTYVTDNPENVPQKFQDETIKYEKKETSTKSVIKSYYSKSRDFAYSYRYLLLGLFILLAFYIFLKRFLRTVKKYSIKRKQNLYKKTINESGIREMSTDEFKESVKEVLLRSGYKLEQIDAPFKTFADFIAEKKRKKYAVLICTAINEISKNQITDIESEKSRYNCDRSIAISRSGFDSDTIDFAKKNNCRLIDENAIAKAIVRKSIV